MTKLISTIDWLLIRVQVACLNEELLELKKLKMDVLVLAEERVLVVGVLQLLVLNAHIPDCSFHLLLDILNILRSIDKGLSCGHDFVKLV